MDDDRLIRRLRDVDKPAVPRDAFVEDLHAHLAGELGLAPRQPAGKVHVRSPRTRGRFGLLAVAAASLVGLSVLGSSLFGRQPPPDPSPTNPASVVDLAAPTTVPSASAAARAVPSATLAASMSALRGPGLVMYEHWDVVTLSATRLEYLAPDGTGHELLPDSEGIQETPAWNRDGTRLAYATFNGTLRETIWETDATGVEPRLLSTDCAPPECLGERDPAYSTDGLRLAFIRTGGTAGGAQTTVLAVRDLQGGGVTELESTRTDRASATLRHPTWAPDGSAIAFSATTWGSDGVAQGSTVSIVNADGTGLRQLVPTELAAGDPTWAGDGSVILFSSWPIHDFLVNDVPAIHLYTVRPDGSDLRQLDAEGGAGAPSWSGDGSQILFTQLLGFTQGRRPDVGGERPNLLVMNADGTDIRPVTAFQKCCRWYFVQQPIR